MTPPRSDYRRPVSWWAEQIVSLGALVAFFYALFFFLALLAPDRMPPQ